MEKNTEKTGEKKKGNVRFNALDLLIILIIAGMIVLVVWQNEIRQMTDNTAYEDIVYSFTVKNIENGREKYLYEGAELTEASGGASMGTLLSCQTESTVLDVKLVDGSTESVKLRDKKDARCTAKMTAVKKENGYFTVGGTIIVSGKTIRVETGKAVFEIKIESVSDRASDVN